MSSVEDFHIILTSYELLGFKKQVETIASTRQPHQIGTVSRRSQRAGVD